VRGERTGGRKLFLQWCKQRTEPEICFLCRPASSRFLVVAFEPLPNEEIIRSNLCMNDAEQERVTAFTKGLGAIAAVCKGYSSPTYNQGNGVVSCDGSIPQHDDGPVTLKGQMEIVPLDDLWRCTKKDLDHEDDTKGKKSNESDGVNHTSQLP